MGSKLFRSFFIFLFLGSLPALAQSNKTVNEQLSMITYLHVNGRSVDIPSDSVLRKHIKLEQITQDEFITKQKTRVNYLLADTTKYKKKKNVLRLPTSTGTKSYTDKLTEEDDTEEYQYLGQFAFLNAYLVYCQYWESVTYKLVSKKDGAEFALLAAMPIISPDKKRIAVIDADPYETDAGIELFSIVNGRPKSTFMARFNTWMPGTEADMFWAADGKLYIPIQLTERFWKPDGSFDTEYLYVRITIL